MVLMYVFVLHYNFIQYVITHILCAYIQLY